MKKVYVLRHANWDLEKDVLTAEGAEKAKTIAEKLPFFSSVVLSPTKRAIETAALLTKANYITDKRAETLEVTDGQSKKIAELREDSPFGAVGALFEIPELAKQLQGIGHQLVELIKDSLSECPEGENILIISHDATMVAAEKILKDKDFQSADKTFGEIEGFIVDEDLYIAPFNLGSR